MTRSSVQTSKCPDDHIFSDTLCLQENFIVDLIYEYLPSIVITLANFITPLLFSIIINYEDYSPAFEIRFTLMRYNRFPLIDRLLILSLNNDV